MFRNYFGGGIGVLLTFMNENEAEKYLALASSTRLSAAWGFTISRPWKMLQMKTNGLWDEMIIKFGFAKGKHQSTFLP